jgi:glutamate-1-semialdehyde 2,1-aminomutase
LLILDEVLTGFRIGPGGWWGEVGRGEGWAPDLLTFGKVIGGGYPLAAVAGRAEVLNLLAPLGPVYQAGTLSGNPVAATAGLVTLRHCDPAAYQRLDQTAARLAETVGAALAEAGVPHRVQAAGNLFSVFFGPDEVTNYAQARRQDTAAYARFFNAMLANGVYLPPSAFEAWFVSTALGDAELTLVANAVSAAAQAV